MLRAFRWFWWIESVGSSSPLPSLSLSWPSGKQSKAEDISCHHLLIVLWWGQWSPILYDFSGHKPDLEGKIQICFSYGFSRPVPVYKHWDCKSARPDPHVSTQKASLTKPELSVHWESRFFQTCHLSKTHGGQVSQTWHLSDSQKATPWERI